MRFSVLVLLITLLTVLPACSSGSGGDNGGNAPAPQPSVSTVFSYPFNGQQDVVLDTQIAVTFADDLPADASDAITLQADDDDTVSIAIDRDDNQPNVLRLVPDGPLRPSTTYKVIATGDGGEQFDTGDTLSSFTTRPRQGRPATQGLTIAETTPGNTNPATGRTALFTEFNALRVRFSEPVDPATVTLGESFTFTGPDGEPVDGRLTVLGRNLTFDPIEDLAPGDYRLALTDAVASVFGNTLANTYSETKTVVSAGNTATENLRVAPTANRPDSILNGTRTNLANISSQLIGSNDQLASNAAARGGVRTTLAEPGLPGFDGVIPAVIRAGQKVALTGLNLRLNGEVQTPIISGPIQTAFINDADVYLMSNDYRDLQGPTAVRLRFDLGISTLIEAAAGTSENVRQALANGVFNQSALNIQAAGLAIPQDNGDLQINAVGTFPINVNRDGDATVQLALSLVLPAGDQDAVQPDTTAPFVTAASPSACLYVFGSPAYDTIYAQQGVAPTALPEKVCADDAGERIDNFPIESSPAVVFSEPLDPASVNAQSIALTSTTSGSPVDATYRVEGTTVVIDPAEPLTQNHEYAISLNNEALLADLAGNTVTADNLGVPLPITFITEPLSDGNLTGPLLGTLSPGIPCALDAEGNFRNGGDVAGNCTGGSVDDANPAFPVFQHPANVGVDAFFSKLVDADTIKLADGCLADGNGPATGNSIDAATVAVQKMDGNGQCLGAVPGRVALGNPGDAITRSFTFRPEVNFEPGTRYWIVVCGSGADASCSSRIADTDGRPLNTDPLNGTTADGDGGQDLIMPFDATAPTDDLYTTAVTLPATDANGNGRVDDGEHPQAANRALTVLKLAGGQIDNDDRDDNKFPTYLSLARPIAIRGLLEGDACKAVDAVVDDNGNPAVGATPDACIPVSLLPGGISALTDINTGVLGARTNRTLLRFPYQDGADGTDNSSSNGNSTPERVAQSGYIIEKCQGTLPGVGEYDYEPCFVASLNLTANAPDAEVLELAQQQITANVVGPVTFEQNGRLVISLRNLNTITLEAKALGLLDATATIQDGDLNFQLTTSPTHGGHEFPNR